MRLAAHRTSAAQKIVRVSINNRADTTILDSYRVTESLRLLSILVGIPLCRDSALVNTFAVKTSNNI